MIKPQWYQDTWILLEMLCCLLSSLGLYMLLCSLFIFPAWNFSWLLKIERVLGLSSSAFSVIIFNTAFLTLFSVSDTQLCSVNVERLNELSTSSWQNPFLFFSRSKALLCKKQCEDRPFWHHPGPSHQHRISGPTESEPVLLQDLPSVCACTEFQKGLL